MKNSQQEEKKVSRPISDLSWDEAVELFSMPKPNTDGFYEQMVARDERLKVHKEVAVQSLNPCLQNQ